MITGNTSESMKNALPLVTAILFAISGCAQKSAEKRAAHRDGDRLLIVLALTEKDGVRGKWNTCSGTEMMNLVVGTNLSARDETGRLVASGSWKNAGERGIDAVATKSGKPTEVVKRWLIQNERSLCLLQAEMDIKGKPEAIDIRMLNENYTQTRNQLVDSKWTLMLGKGNYDLDAELKIALSKSK